MTSIEELAKTLYDRVSAQEVPEQVTIEQLTTYIAGGVRYLYTMTGRALTFDESLFVKDGDYYVSFVDDLYIDEKLYVIVTANIDFLKWVQGSVNNQIGYTTDAMSVTHADKPYANLADTIARLEDERNRIWYKMIRFHLL